MANRNFNRNVQHFARDVVMLFAEITWASGAPTLVTSNRKSQGITSITDTGSGDLLITLRDKYPYLLFVGVSHSVASAADVAFDSVSHLYSASAGTLQLVFRAIDGSTAVQDPADGTMRIMIVLRND